jgi:hypothetical protein
VLVPSAVPLATSGYIATVLADHEPVVADDEPPNAAGSFDAPMVGFVHIATPTTGSLVVVVSVAERK